MRSVHIYPSFGGEDQGDGGVRRVAEAQARHLPAFGFEPVASPEDAEIIACHITVPTSYVRLYPEKPLVAHCHGLYWAQYDWANWALKANADVMELLRVADAITAPSEWVAQAMRRHTSRPITVVPHGVDLDEWTGGTPQGYVLWNKTRLDPVCDPAPVTALAALMPDVLFVSTFGSENLCECPEPEQRHDATCRLNDPRFFERLGRLAGLTTAGSTEGHNLFRTYRLPYALARDFVRNASVYLATAKETFGIGTLEALAAGIPVVGFRHGGQAEIIEQGRDGWLVEPGDVEGLAEGVRWALANGEAAAAACRAKAALFPWEGAARKYADLYETVISRAESKRTSPAVSVIVTAYKLDAYLGDCLVSVLRQSSDDWECIVVDDASPDQCGAIADEFARLDDRFRVIHNETNQYLAGARNTGIAVARGPYILPLDADDMLAPDALTLLVSALDADRTIHIAYGCVRFVDEDGKTATDYHVAGQEAGHSGWPLPFEFERQAKGLNYLPYASMYRREVWEWTGGYRQRCRTAEDADFWIRASSYGFRPRYVTPADTLIYRNREGSMSREIGRREWIRWFPWGADLALAPAGAITRQQLAVPSYDPPAVSIVIPVGPGHQHLLMDALDSLDAQSYRKWEAIVVNDTGAPLPNLPAWARVIEPDRGPDPGGPDPGEPGFVKRFEKQWAYGRFGGVAAARNAGIAHARADLFLPLDADDLLEPDALQWLLTAYEQAGGGVIIYPDFWEDPEEPGRFRPYACPDFDPALLIRRGALHPVTALTPVAFWREVGGYDEEVPCWEDWAFALACAERGLCSQRLPAPLFTYRKHTGARREENQAAFDDCRDAMQARFGHFWDGGKDIMSCGCRKTGPVDSPAGPRYSRAAAPPAADAVQVRYVGNKMGSILFKGPSGTVYSFEAGDPARWALAADVEYFTGRPDFQVLAAGGAMAMVGPEATPFLVAEGPPVREPSREPVAVPAGHAIDGSQAVARALAGEHGGMTVERETEEGVDREEYASEQELESVDIRDVDPELAIAAFMGLGLSREEAEKRVRPEA